MYSLIDCNIGLGTLVMLNKSKTAFLCGYFDLVFVKSGSLLLVVEMKSYSNFNIITTLYDGKLCNLKIDDQAIGDFYVVSN